MSAVRRQGFTLVEVLVAVVLSGIVALLAHQLFGAAVDGGRRLRDARLGLDRRGNAHQLLRAAFLSLEVGIDSAGPFSGHRDRVRFSSWLLSADGWLERRTIELGLDGDRWIVAAPPDPDIELADSVTGLRFDYLLEPGAEATWVVEWESAVSAPLAVRVRLMRTGERVDTMLYLIKARG
ncbi:MAG: prepilin-type N-terminal cleavage/methylation domain-containing protein [Gemmatimonadales bacterium]